MSEQWDCYTFPCSFQDDIQILKVEGDRIPLLNLCCGNQTVLICEKTVSDVQRVCGFTCKLNTLAHEHHPARNRGLGRMVLLLGKLFLACCFVLTYQKGIPHENSVLRLKHVSVISFQLPWLCFTDMCYDLLPMFTVRSYFYFFIPQGSKNKWCWLWKHNWNI